MDRMDIVDHVRREKSRILDELNCDQDDKLTRIDNISKKIDEIKNLVHQYTPTMIAYDIRSCNDIIKELETTLQKYRVPTKPFKFSFDIRKKSGNNNSTKTVDAVDSSSSSSSNPAMIIELDTPGFKNRSNENLILDKPEQTDGKDIVIESLDNCQLRIQGVPSSLRLRNLRNCQIYTGPVRTSTYVEKCSECQFEIIAQQIRIHETKKCDFYLHVTSRIIMENSSDLRFGQYKWLYDQLDNDFKRSNIDPLMNNWKCIDDFDCVHQNQSPNWSFIPME
ncbi:tubulin-binding cofactor C [Dermatophagoides pteronyssinus]|uniref:Tubulin-specific chaperone C-like n=2 Tax=Dermatophagoides pteronyssinus TaxID=6956 RepID=A0A6P6YAH6_DERPT|nr:tubulin-specific chaperone C-like [Dermatophagoides pteronyssinus]KAH9423504.1 hypothetical protein DERP_003785 [Dermatophagoides pteronyssinus]